MFAKLFNGTEHGQILVKIDQGDEKEAEVRFYFEPEGLGVCSLALQFDGEDAWDRADDAFAKVDEGTAVAMVNKVKGQLEAL